MKEKLNSVKKFVSDHRVAIAVTTTAAVTTVLYVKLQMRNAGILNEFLKEHNLFDEYYRMDEI